MVLLSGRRGLRSDVNDDAAVFDSVDNSEVLAAVAIGWGCRGPFHGIARRPIAQWRGPRRTRPYTKRTQGSVFASPVHEFPDFGNNDGTFTNRGSDTLD